MCLKTMAGVVAIVGLVGAASMSAVAQDRHFVELRGESSTTIYDTRTAETVHPGRFVILSTVIDDPDVMAVELEALQVARKFCSKPFGQYPPPAETLTAGPAERPTKIVVDKGVGGKYVMWELPYTRWGKHRAVVTRCAEGRYEEARSQILNGTRMKTLFDCKRALRGMFVDVTDPLSEAITTHIYDDTRGAVDYELVCRRVTGEAPYAPHKRKP